MTGANGQRPHWRLFLSELVGTGLLVLVGLSVVILMFGDGNPMMPLLPSEGLRRLVTGFLFGTTGALIAVSPVGRVSGAHINPAVTFGFWLWRKIDTRTAIGYVLGQLAGAVLGSLPLLAWGAMGRSVDFGATAPCPGCSPGAALLGETITTFAMVALLSLFLGFRGIRRFTPAIFPPLYAVMVYAEAPLSGASTNPARTLGPAVVSGQWDGWWIYWVGPLLGAAVAAFACRNLARRIEGAKLYHFDTDPVALLRRTITPLVVVAGFVLPGTVLGAPAAPDGSVLVYIGTYTGTSSKGIYVSRFDSRTGELSNPELAATTTNPSFLARDPDGGHLYAVNEVDRNGQERSGAVSAFAIERSTGRLSPLGQVSTHGTSPCHLSTDREGRHLFVANYGGGSIAVLPIRPDGSIGPASSVVQHEGRGPDPGRQEGPHVHQVSLDPSNALLWAADLGLDKVVAYRLDSRTGALLRPPAAVATLAPGSGPRHFTFTSTGSHMFVLGEMSSTVTSFSLDRPSGAATRVQTVSTLDDGVAVTPAFKAAEIQLHPSGRFLYASSRGPDSVVLFAVAEGTGTLTRVEGVPSGGRTPRAFAIDPKGRYLVVANQDSDELVVLRIDPATGRLTPTGARVRVGSPVSVLFARVGGRSAQ